MSPEKSACHYSHCTSAQPCPGWTLTFLPAHTAVRNCSGAQETNDHWRVAAAAAVPPSTPPLRPPQAQQS